MSRYSISSRRKKRKDQLGIVLFVICILATTVFSYFFFSVKGMKIDIDEVSLCPKDGEKGINIVLVDRSDPFSNMQVLEIKNFLKNIKDDLPTHHKLSIYTIDESKTNTNIQHVIGLCNPGDGSDSNPFISNPKKIKDRWNSDFSTVLDNAIEKSVSSGNYNHSPIMESIREISVKEFESLKRPDTKKAFIIISDMMQNNNEISHYKSVDSYEHFLSNPINFKYIPDFNGANVHILYLTRDKIAKYQNSNHVVFWQRYIKESNGTLVSVKRIAN